MTTSYATLMMGGTLLANLLIAAMLVHGVHRRERVHAVGMAETAMGVPLVVAPLIALIDGREASGVRLTAKSA